MIHKNYLRLVLFMLHFHPKTLWSLFSVNGTRAICCSAAHTKLSASSAGFGLPFMSGGYIACCPLRHMAISIWQGNSLYSIPERIKVQTDLSEFLTTGSRHPTSPQPGWEQVQCKVFVVISDVIHKVHTLVSYKGSSVGS